MPRARVRSPGILWLSPLLRNQGPGKSCRLTSGLEFFSKLTPWLQNAVPCSRSLKLELPGFLLLSAGFCLSSQMSSWGPSHLTTWQPTSKAAGKPLSSWRVMVSFFLYCVTILTSVSQLSIVVLS